MEERYDVIIIGGGPVWQLPFMQEEPDEKPS